MQRFLKVSYKTQQELLLSIYARLGSVHEEGRLYRVQSLLCGPPLPSCRPEGNDEDPVLKGRRRKQVVGLGLPRVVRLQAQRGRTEIERVSKTKKKKETSEFEAVQERKFFLLF